jgi:hypothetical protein
MARKKLSPGELVVERFAAAGISARKLGELVGRDHSRIVRLTKPRPEGTGGQVPSGLQRILLELAPQHGVELTAEELITGG